MRIRKPLLSVVIPIYNVENYLAQTLDSVIHQSLDFTTNTELILVNDGSPDNSEEICLRYKEWFPDNIVYIKQKNAGVSAARNTGLKKARGTYVHFMDSDDVISKNFYKESVKFLQEHANEVDFVASKIKYFDAKYTGHYLNGKFNNTRIIDVLDEPERSVFHVPTVVFRSSAIKTMEFDTELKVTEDAKFLNELLHRKKKYGALTSTCLYYRKRSDGSSAISTKLSNRSYYVDTPRLFHFRILDLWRDANGKLLRYAQHLLMNDIAWKISEEKSQHVLSPEEEHTYKQTIYSLVKSIDDDIIVTNRILNIDQKTFLLRKKYGAEKYEQLVSVQGLTYLFGGKGLFTPDWKNEDATLVLDFIHDDGVGKYKIEGYAQRATISGRDKRFLKTSKGVYELQPVERAQRRDGFLGDAFTDDEAFEAYVEVGSEDTICGLLRRFDGHDIPLPISTKQFTGLGVLNTTYRRQGEVIFRKSNNTIEVHPYTRKKIVSFEARFSLQILRNIQLREVIAWTKRTVVNMDSLLMLAPRKTLVWESVGPLALLARSALIGLWDTIFRQLYFAGLYRSKRPIWLISDRGTVAGDNGEALFRYIMDNEKPDADVYFVISKKSPDYKRLQAFGKVLDIDSLKYKMLFLRADKIISSAADYYVYNAFGYRWTHLSDLYNFDFIFLQHGIIKDDLSSWLNRFEKNIKIFVTSAKPEYDSVLHGTYYYETKNVLLSGLPRYDLLTNDPKNKLMLAPTWRQNLLPEERHGKSGIRGYSSTFKHTQYFKFYNALMNDERITHALKEAGMIGELYLHPAFSRQGGDFQQNDTFKIAKLPYNYRRAFSESNILITDYSSVAFDFAYLKKPVIYTQFDKDSLYESHIYEAGYFSYEEDGFGPVAYDYESTIALIVQFIKDKAKFPEKYVQRTEKFFYKFDKNNSKRVYEAIVE